MSRGSADSNDGSGFGKDVAVIDRVLFVVLALENRTGSFQAGYY